jgi:hypothetical protein
MLSRRSLANGNLALHELLGIRALRVARYPVP